MCRWLADGKDATAQPPNGGTPLVAVLHAPRTKDPAVWNEHVQQARHALSEGRVVVLLGASETEPEYNWDEETLSRIACHQPNGANLEWQCM
jgi:hypothetical protein